MPNAAPPDMTSPSRVLDAVTPTADWLLRMAWRAGANGVPLEQARSGGQRDGRDFHEAMASRARAQLEGIADHPLNPLIYKPGQRGACEAFNQWWDDRQPVVRGVETYCERRDLMLRGYVDLVIACPGCPLCHRYAHDSESTGDIIIDYKTASITTARNHLQVGGFYRLLWRARANGRPICGARLVGLDIDGDCRPREVPARGTPQRALQALAWYRDLQATATEAALDEPVAATPHPAA